MRIPGAWKEGFVLDYHTLSSQIIGYDEYGHPCFNTVRTEIGELLFGLKYKGEQDNLSQLILASERFIAGRWRRLIEGIVPVPPSRRRLRQPVMALAEGIAATLHLPVLNVVRRTPTGKELKNVFDYHERIELLEHAFRVAANAVQGRTVLLVDDLYRSGATLNAVTASLYDPGGAAAVYAFALTRTRSTS